MAATSSNWRTSTPADTLTPGHGAKRRLPPETDDAEAAQRLAKRFHLLNIENNGRLWVAPNNDAAAAAAAEEPVQLPASSSRAAHNASAELMQIEGTKDKVYIHNLDEELAEASDEDRQEERLIFIPDIERRLNKLPLRALLAQPEERTGSQMVLYSVPKALSVPEEQDSVRRAILESRARRREQQSSPSRDALLHEETPDPLAAHDDDAMDLG